jgi:hypothetical protein
MINVLLLIEKLQITITPPQGLNFWGQRLTLPLPELILISTSPGAQCNALDADLKEGEAGGEGLQQASEIVEGALMVSLVPRVTSYRDTPYFRGKTLSGRMAVTDFSLAYTGNHFARLSAPKRKSVSGSEVQVGIYTRFPCEYHGEFSADYEQCSIFYKCDNFRYVKFRCPGNLKWNQAKQLCDWVCEKGEVSFITNGPRGTMKTTEKLIYLPPSTTPTPTKSVVTPSRVTGATELSGQVCFKSGAYLPDLGDCSVVYQCVSGQLIKLFCRNGLFWNHMKQVCDTKCERRGYFTLEPRTGNPTSATPYTVTITKASPTTALPTPSGSSNGYRTEISCTDVYDYIKDQVSDQIFYRCIHGTLFRFNCQDGTIWNQELKVCQMKPASIPTTAAKTTARVSNYVAG